MSEHDHTEISVKPLQDIPRLTIRFAGDSGDGMQLTGERFAAATALAGNDLRTYPDFPAEIRAPAGTLSGVSGFQIQLGTHEILTPGDAPDVLVAMNPAALKTGMASLVPGGTIIVNDDAFTETNLYKAGYTANPLEDGSLNAYQVYRIPISRLTEEALASSPLSPKQKDRCKNFFVLGLVSWLYSRPIDPTIQWIAHKFVQRPEIVEANTLAFKAGYHFGETTERFSMHYRIPQATIEPGLYRKITGNEAFALGCVAAAHRAGRPLVYASYPITPASEILHELARYKAFDIRTFQAEDEIAAVCTAIGASFAGALGVTGTSGPGLDLKSEAIGLAVMAELPLVVIDVQRGGPSTGLPTKPEQADLLQALFGRHGECPVVVLAARSPADCFATVYEALQLAVTYMLPVLVLSDAFLANSAEPWRIPSFATLPPIPITHPHDAQEPFHPYRRDPVTLARPWAIPGTPGLEHRIGGLEKEDGTGGVSYDPLNHERMTQHRADKLQRCQANLPPLAIHGDPSGDVLVVGWGSTYGAITAAVSAARQAGRSASSIHLRHLNPFPPNLGEILSRFRTILVPELNRGQLLWLLRARFLVDAQGLHKVQGQPLKASEVLEAIDRCTGKRALS
ncbi:MAG: 2-oxoacid:acceptor oxidoreductase subunit alpha [Nitrospirae bacterium]|nr:MAG: 2-oxoacid:acceptor oxidoreductase subunit alpha [Nitrospirota bacterium]